MLFLITGLLLFRLIDIGISYLSPQTISYLGFFPYKEVLKEYGLPQFISSFANFDGAHYLLIARQGYSQYEQAFFPLYPLLIRYLSPLFANNHLLTAFLISNISFFIGLLVFSKYLRLISIDSNKSQLVSILLFLLLFPTSFFFGAVYTEGLFFLLLISALYFLKKERYLLVAIFAFFASLTKLIGVFLIVPIAFSIYKSYELRVTSYKKNKTHKLFSFLASNYYLLATILSPLLGLLAYSLYLLTTTGDPLFFLHSQWAFGANRSSNLVLLPQVYYRYFNIFFTAAWNFQYFISLFEFFTFNFVFIVLVLDLFKSLNLKFVSPRLNRDRILNFDRLGLSLFSLVNLVLPTLTGTLSSIPRYALFSLSFFLFLGQIRNTLLKISIAIIFLLLHMVMLGFFIQGYFIS